MMRLLDTNICIHLINRKPVSVLDKLLEHDPREIMISPITVSELQFGIENSRRVEENRSTLKDFLSSFVIPPYDKETAVHYGKLRARLGKTAKLIGAMDLLIAAHALALNAIVVTNDVKDFGRIPGIKMENWV